MFTLQLSLFATIQGLKTSGKLSRHASILRKNEDAPFKFDKEGCFFATASFVYADPKTPIQCHVARDPNSLVIFEFKQSKHRETHIDMIKAADIPDGTFWGQARCDGVVGYIDMANMKPTFAVTEFPTTGCKERPKSEMPPLPQYIDYYDRFSALQATNPELADKITALMEQRDARTAQVLAIIEDIKEHTNTQTERTATQIQKMLFDPTDVTIQTIAEKAAAIYQSSVVGAASPLKLVVTENLKKFVTDFSDGSSIVQAAIDQALEQQADKEQPNIFTYYEAISASISNDIANLIEPVKVLMGSQIEDLVSALGDSLVELSTQLSDVVTQLGSESGDGIIPVLGVKIANYIVQTLGNNIFNDTAFLEEFALGVYDIDFVNNISDPVQAVETAVQAAGDIITTAARAVNQKAVSIINDIVTETTDTAKGLIYSSFQENTNGMEVFDEQVRANLLLALSDILQQQQQLATNSVQASLLDASFLPAELEVLKADVQNALTAAMTAASAKVSELLLAAAEKVNGKVTKEVEDASMISQENPTKIAKEVVAILYDEDITRIPTEDANGEINSVRQWTDGQILVAGYAAALAADPELEFSEGQRGDYLFDAIGFVSYVYQKAISRPLPTNYLDLSLAGASVVEDLSKLQGGNISMLMPGDVLLFAKAAYESIETMVLDHAAIYLGHGLMAHAQSKVAGLQYQTHLEDVQWLRKVEAVVRFNTGQDGNFTDPEAEDEEDIAIETEESENDHPDDPIVDPNPPVNPDGEEEEVACAGCQIVTAQTLLNLGWAGVTSTMVEELNAALTEFGIVGDGVYHFIAQATVASQGGQWPIEPQSGLEFKADATLGNANEDEVKLYKGAGYIRLRGKTAYEAFKTQTGDDDVLLGAAYVGTYYAWKAAAHVWNAKGLTSVGKEGENLTATVEAVTVALYGDSSIKDTVQKYYDYAKQFMPAVVAETPTQKYDYERVVSLQVLKALGWTDQEDFEQQLAETLDIYHIDTPEKIWHFLAQAAWKSGYGASLIDDSAPDLDPSEMLYMPAGYIRISGKASYEALQQEIGDSMITSQGAFYVAQNYPWRAAGFAWNAAIAAKVTVGGEESLASVCEALYGAGADCTEVTNILLGVKALIPSASPYNPLDPRVENQVVSIADLAALGWVNLSRGLAAQLNNVLHAASYTTADAICKFLATAAQVSNLGEKAGSQSVDAADKWLGAGYIPISGETSYTALNTMISDSYITELGAPYVTERYPWAATYLQWTNQKLNEQTKFEDIAGIIYPTDPDVAAHAASMGQLFAKCKTVLE